MQLIWTTKHLTGYQTILDVLRQTPVDRQMSSLYIVHVGLVMDLLATGIIPCAAFSCMARILCALSMNSGRNFHCDNAKTISGENPTDKDLELLLAEIGECLLWRYLVSPRSIPVARLFLSLVFTLPTSSPPLPLIPWTHSQKTPLKRRTISSMSLKYTFVVRTHFT